MRRDKDKNKKKKKNDSDPFLIREAGKILEASLEAAFM